MKCIYQCGCDLNVMHMKDYKWTSSHPLPAKQITPRQIWTKCMDEDKELRSKPKTFEYAKYFFKWLVLMLDLKASIVDTVG